mmetsp:Transcript_19765/g.49923  ORF Transcript_19765/g.49923 Transcript_19765/m.49923 type:complete len:295 (-) Transcript_19765:161-1045(-)
MVRQHPDQEHRRDQRDGGKPRADAQYPHAPAQVRQPPVPVRRCGAASIRQRPAAHQQLRQDAAPRQAPQEDARGRPPRPRLQPDDAHARHPRGLPHVAQLQVPQARRRRLRRGAHAGDERVQQRPHHRRLPPLDARGRPRDQPGLGGHVHHLRQRLEPARGPAGAGPLPPHRSDQDSHRLPAGDGGDRRGEGARGGQAEAQAGAARRLQGQVQGHRPEDGQERLAAGGRAQGAARLRPVEDRARQEGEQQDHHGRRAQARARPHQGAGRGQGLPRRGEGHQQLRRHGPGCQRRR